MLNDGISLLHEEHPIAHSERGRHYHGTEWIERMEAAGFVLCGRRDALQIILTLKVSLTDLE